MKRKFSPLKIIVCTISIIFLTMSFYGAAQEYGIQKQILENHNNMTRTKITQVNVEIKGNSYFVEPIVRNNLYYYGEMFFISFAIALTIGFISSKLD